MNEIWMVANEEQFRVVKRFKEIFINQEKDNIQEIFDENFGIHNGYDVNGYCNYEFEEFALKCERFGLTNEAKIECFNIGNNYIYFSLGKKEDKAVFEAIFEWDSQSNKLKGNQYYYKIEPKIQFCKNFQTNEIKFNRRINIKAPSNEILVKKVMTSYPCHEINFFKQELEEIFGGNFYSILYLDDDFKLDTYWNDVSIFSNQKNTKNKVLMRGKDHPLFMDNLFPEIVSDYEFKINEDVFPVILTIEFDDGSEEMIKYPLEKVFKFKKKITMVDLTDTLSFDWIITNVQKN